MLLGEFTVASRKAIGVVDAITTRGHRHTFQGVVGIAVECDILVVIVDSLVRSHSTIFQNWLATSSWETRRVMATS